MRKYLESLQYPQMTETVHGSDYGHTTIHAHRTGKRHVAYTRHIDLTTELANGFHPFITHSFDFKSADEIRWQQEAELAVQVAGLPGVENTFVHGNSLTIQHTDMDAYMAFEERRTEAHYLIGSFVIGHDPRMFTRGITTPDGYRIEA